MKPFTRAAAVIGFAACCFVSGSATPAICIHFPMAMTDGSQTTQVESVGGRIIAVAGNTFTIEPSYPETNGTKAVTITIDQDTVVHGKIAVGLKAVVTFRREDHNNIAVTVRTSSA